MSDTGPQGTIFNLHIPNTNATPIQLSEIPTTGTVTDFHRWFYANPLPNRDLVGKSLIDGGKRMMHPLQQILTPPREFPDHKRGERTLFFMARISEPGLMHGEIPQINLEIQKLRVQLTPVELEWQRLTVSDPDFFESMDRLVSMLVGENPTILSNKLAWRAGVRAMNVLESLPHFSPNPVKDHESYANYSGRVQYAYPHQRLPGYQPTPGDCPESVINLDPSLPEWKMESVCGLYNLTVKSHGEVR